MKDYEEYLNLNKDGIKSGNMPRSEIVYEAMKKGDFPYFLSHEFFRFYEMLEEKQLTGAWYEMKDVIEVMIKFPVLVALAYIVREMENETGFQELEKTQDIGKLFKNLVHKELALGDWKKMAVALSRLSFIEENLPSIKSILDNVKCLDRDYDVIKWRNHNIGHGALPFESNRNFIEEFVHKVYGINVYLEKSKKYYQDIQIFYNNKLIKKWEEIKPEQAGKVTLRIADEAEISLRHFIIDHEFFFDGFIKNVFLSYCISYINGTRKRSEISYHKRIFHATKGSSQDFRDTSSDTVTAEMDKLLRELNAPETYMNFEIIDHWIQNRLGISQGSEKRDRGLFLLLMDRGMGKTAFVSNLDQLIHNEPEIYENFVTRVYYCNALEYRGAEDFVESVNVLFKLNKDTNRTIVKDKFKELTMNGGHGELAEVLGDILEKLQDVEDLKEKLLFIIDGLDEIQGGGKSNIFHFIPTCQELPRNVYILLTCRNEDTQQLKDYTKRYLQDIIDNKLYDPQDMLDVSLGNRDIRTKYKKLLNKYLTRRLLHIGKKGDEIDKDFRERLLEQAGYRFLNYKLEVELLIECVNHEMDYERIVCNDNIVDDFFNYIRNMFGKKMFKLAVRILVIISTSYIPLSLKQISFLSELKPDTVPLSVLAVIKTFDSLLIKIRTGYGTGIKIANEAYRERIVEVFGSEVKELVSDWMEYIGSVYGLFCKGELKYQENGMYDNPGEIYLYAYLYDYVKQCNNTELWEKIQEEHMIGAILAYEQYMPAAQIGYQARFLDMNMTNSCIELLTRRKELGRQYDKRALATAYNNYAFHYSILYQDLLKRAKSKEEEQRERKKVIGLYDNAIAELISIYGQKDETLGINMEFSNEDLMIMSKLYSGKGVFLNKFKENLDEIEELFLESLHIVQFLLENGVKKSFYLYIPSVIRVLDIYNIRKFEKAKEVYLEAAVRIKEIKEKLGGGDLENTQFVYNLVKRIDHGIIYQEAQLLRKMASIYHKKELEPGGDAEGGLAESLYKKAIELFDTLEISRENENEKDNVNLAKWKVVFEYGRFLKDMRKIEDARILFDKAADITDILWDRAKIPKDAVLKGFYEAWFDINKDSQITGINLKRTELYRQRMISM